MHERPADDARRAGDPGIHNELSGVVHGDVVQARQIGTVNIGARGPEFPVPKQLPRGPSRFVNRESEIATIDRFATQPAVPGTPPVVVLCGGHGVGKSATGAHWAHQNSGRYGDGQLYRNFGELRHRGGVGVSDVLGEFLRALGLEDAVIPPGLAERAALFRSRIAGKRLLVLLDDVDHAAQVKPLIPSSAECLVLVTSRAPLEELLHDGADVVRVAPLDDPSARRLLHDLIGECRVAAEPEAVETLARYCAGLPIALRVCAARLSGRHAHRPVSWLTADLADEDRRLERMRSGTARSLQAVFDAAYHALPDDAARLYRRLGLHPGPTFTVPVAAAALPTDAETASQLLDALSEAHLVEDTGARFRFHDLLRSHARGAARRDESSTDQDATVHAFVTHYLASTRRMDRAIAPERLRLAKEPPALGVGGPSPDSPATALEWFEAERPNLLAIERAAAERGWNEQVWHLAEAMWLGYHNHKHFEESREVYAAGVAAAAAGGPPEAEARMRQQLSRALIDLGEYDLAERELDTALRLMEGSPHRRLRASVVEFTGVLHLNRGQYKAALAAFDQARAVYEDERNPRGVLLQHYLAGRALIALGDFDEAYRRLQAAVELTDPATDGLTYGRTLIQLAAAQRALGQRAAAEATLELASSTTRQNQAPYYELKAEEGLADLRREAGDRAGEARHLRRVLDLMTQLGGTGTSAVAARLQTLDA
jgi:tetratricopeptide (TPR) repeat protein